MAELRIGQACALLVNSERPIAHIADDVGYANLANLRGRGVNRFVHSASPHLLIRISAATFSLSEKSTA